MAVPQERLRVTERPLAAPLETARVSWGGVWSGFLVGVGVLLLLSALGLAVGVTTADVGQGAGAGARALGIGAGIWAGLSLLLAVFLGGVVSSRVSIVIDRGVAMVHGVLVWVLTTLTVLYLAGTGIGLGMSGLLGVARGAGAAIGTAAGGLGDLASGDVSQVLARLDDPKTVGVVVGATGMSQEEARAALADIRQRVDAARNDPGQALAEARTGVQQLTARAGARASQAAQQAQPYASAAAWTTFGAMVIALIAAILGAVWGARRTDERLLRS
jgi:ElaB/YqjD/DUF883 family membrane-anchored ribosome-binding protein